MIRSTLVASLLLVASQLDASQLVAVEKAPPLSADWPPEQVADGVYVIHGPLDTPNPLNQGFMNNPGFLLTDDGVVVVDPGGSVQVGEMVLEVIETITEMPIIAVFNTHMHGDHWLGNQAIKSRYPDAVIYGHQNMIDAVDQGYGDEWMTMVMRMTDDAVAGTEIVNADTPVAHGDTINIGSLSFDVFHNGKAHTNSDIMIHIPEKGVMFLGDNASVNRVIRNEGSVKGNIEALQMAIETGDTLFVPGHGPSSHDSGKIYQDYLKAVYAQVRKGYDDGLIDYEIKPMAAAALGGYRNWADFDRLLGKHINSIYMEIEADEF